jgi:molecular chaperone GrpE
MSGDNTDEEFILEDEAENPALVVKRLRERLQKTEAERAEYLEGWQRSRADFANLKKDEELRHQYSEDRLRVSLAEEIIPVLDGFEMAFKAPSWQKADPEWKKGIEGLYNQLKSALSRFGVTSYRATEGLSFDPTKHEAVREVPVEREESDHTIVSTEASGYTLGDFIIRPAQVSVATYNKQQVR